MSARRQVSELKPPIYYENLISAVCDDDRAWFERNPGRNARTRDLVPGEFWPVEFPIGSKVLVQQLAPGVRTRSVVS